MYTNQRIAYGSTLVELGKENPNIVGILSAGSAIETLQGVSEMAGKELAPEYAQMKSK